MAEIKNLMEGLLEEMNRVRETIAEYKSLPKNAGMIGAALMEIDIKNAERAIVENDVVKMLIAYQNLKKLNNMNRIKISEDVFNFIESIAVEWFRIGKISEEDYNKQIKDLYDNYSTIPKPT